MMTFGGFGSLGNQKSWRSSLSLIYRCQRWHFHSCFSLFVVSQWYNTCTCIHVAKSVMWPILLHHMMCDWPPLHLHVCQAQRTSIVVKVWKMTTLFCDFETYHYMWYCEQYLCVYGFTIWRWPQRNVVSVRVTLELTQVQLDNYLTSISQCSTNHIVQNLTSGIEFDWWNLPWLCNAHNACTASIIIVNWPHVW